jgi:RNA polymerase sigma-70 factor (ECF subfamily)
MYGAQPADEQVAARVSGGDEGALGVLYDRYSRAVYSLILRMVRDQQAAEDLTQDVFLRVWQQAGTYSREKGRFVSWILGIAHNAAVDELRRRKARPQQVYEDPAATRSFLDMADGSPGLDELALNGVRREAIVEALALLPRDQREVIELAYFGGHTQSQIAVLTGQPLGTIKTRTRLALHRLREALLARGIEADAFR